MLPFLFLIAISECSVKRQRRENGPFSSIPTLVAPGYTIVGVSGNGRWVERIASNRTFAGIQKIAQMDSQYDEFTCRNFTHMVETTPVGELILGRRVSGSTQSVLFEIGNSTNALIKYQMNCMENFEGKFFNEVPVHPLVRDYFFLRAAKNTGIVPNTFFLSPPSFLCPDKSGKCAFRIPDDEFIQCRKDFAALRYMVMERVRGSDLHQFKNSYPSGVVPLNTVLWIGIALIDALEKLHVEAHVVHGDIHASNIVLETEGVVNETAKIKFVDFGRASWNGIQTNVPTRSRHFTTDVLFSRWELLGYPVSARDDVDRAMHTTARLMNARQYSDYEDSIMKHGTHAVELHKDTSAVFYIPGIKNSMEEFSPMTQISLKSRFDQIVELVKSMTDINSVPKYAEIRERFRECLKQIGEIRERDSAPSRNCQLS